MRFWAFLLAIVVIVAGGALAVRHYGIDLAALSGLQKFAATSQEPNARVVSPARAAPLRLKRRVRLLHV